MSMASWFQKVCQVNAFMSKEIHLSHGLPLTDGKMGKLTEWTHSCTNAQKQRSFSAPKT